MGLRNYTFQSLAASLACCILLIFFRTGISMPNWSLIKVSFKHILLSSSQAAAFYFSFIWFLSYHNFFCQDTIKWTEMALLNTRTFSGHHRLAQRALTVWLERKSNTLRTTMTSWGAVLCLHAHFALPDWIPFPSLSRGCPSSALPSHAPHRPIPLCFPATSPAGTAGEPDESWGSSKQTPTTPASKCSFQFVHLPEPAQCQLTWSQCWLKGAVRLQEPQVRPRAMEMLPLVLQDRQDSREPDWTTPGIKIS